MVNSEIKYKSNTLLEVIRNLVLDFILYFVTAYTRGQLKLYATHSSSILCQTYHNTNFSNYKIKSKKRLYFESFCVILFIPARNYLFKVSNLRTKTRCESCLILTMSMLTIFNINDVNGIVLVSLLLTVNIFQTLF